ncbi:MAG: PaaX family transcriptional regulator C-terminal domain-containing protein [Solirubrobacteraceae bacterium]
MAEITPGMGLVCFAFGLVRAVRPEPQLPGPVLMRLLRDLGLSEAAGRSVVLRMRREGWLSSERVGREARYRLAPAIDAAQDRVDRRLHGDRPEWNGAFNGVLFTVPERHRAFRDRLRRCAQLLGYVRLRPCLLIATTDRCEELISLLPPSPPDSQMLSVRLTLSAQDSHRVVGELWGLDALAARYRTVLADARDRTTRAERHHPCNTAAFQAFAAATLPVYEIAGEDPDLPAALLPPDWPGQRVGATLHRAFHVFGPLLEDYLTTVTGHEAARPAPHLASQTAVSNQPLTPALPNRQGARA